MFEQERSIERLQMGILCLDTFKQIWVALGIFALSTRNQDELSSKIILYRPSPSELYLLFMSFARHQTPIDGAASRKRIETAIVLPNPSAIF